MVPWSEGLQSVYIGETHTTQSVAYSMYMYMYTV